MDRRVTPTKQVTSPTCPPPPPQPPHLHVNRPLVVKRSHVEMDYKQLTPLPNDDILLTVAQ